MAEKKFWTRKFGYRLAGNFGLTFLAPFVGTQVVLSSDYLDSVFISLIASGIVTGLIFFRRVEQFGNTTK